MALSHNHRKRKLGGTITSSHTEEVGEGGRQKVVKLIDVTTRSTQTSSKTNSLDHHHRPLNR